MFGKQKKDKYNPAYKPIVFVNNPIMSEQDDVIGFDSQVATLESAVEKGASMIGVIADYGSGKSSMTEILVSRLKKRKIVKKEIKVNLWDCLKIEESHKNSSNQDKISLLTRSFLYQLANGYNYKFGNFINKILSTNYGNLSFGVNSRKFWWLFVLAGITFTGYEICSSTQTGIMQYLSAEHQEVVAYIKLFHPMLLLISAVFLILGLKDTYLAFSHWKMPDKRELEINDVFNTYSIVINKIASKMGKKKCVILIEDLDRIAEKELITEFLKELYRFQDSLGKHKEKFVFMISIKPEVELKSETKDNKIYSKIFDAILYLKPVHFDDYDSVLLKLLESNVKEKKELEELIEYTIESTLPQSFKWIKKGENLTLRDLKERLNQAIAIMLSVKNKDYQVSTAVNFEACAAVAYLESRYPKCYYQLIKKESSFAVFMRESMKIINEYKEEINKRLIEAFQIAFSQDDLKKEKEFQNELCGLVETGVFNDDFRMYFYTYPKGSHIKTTDERELCDYLLYPNLYKEHRELDSLVNRVFKYGDNFIVTATLKSLEEFPEIVLENDRLFQEAVRISFEKAFKIFAQEIILSNHDSKEKKTFWERLRCLKGENYRKFISASVEQIIGAEKEEKEITELRKDIIGGLGHGITDFEKLYKDPMPLITWDEFILINDPKISLQFLIVHSLKSTDFEQVSAMLNRQILFRDRKTFEKACKVWKNFVEIMTPQEIGARLLRFMNVNRCVDDCFIEKIGKADLPLKDVANYLNKLSTKMLTDTYRRVINDLGFPEYIFGGIVEDLLSHKLYYTPLLYCANADDFSRLDSCLENDAEILAACERVNDYDSDYIIKFRKYLVEQNRLSKYRELYFEPYPMVTPAEYFDPTLVDTSQIDADNVEKVAKMMTEHSYSLNKTMSTFNWLFNKEVNEAYIAQGVLKKTLFDAMELKRLQLSRLDEDQRGAIYDLVSDVCPINTSQEAIEVMRCFGCLIPKLELMVQSDKTASANYSLLIADMDDLTSITSEWLENHYICNALSEKLCRRLYEQEDYENYIVGEILRTGRMVMDEQIGFPLYLNVYQNVNTVFDVMAGHWDFLERLQMEGDFSELTEEQIRPMFKVPQHTRFIQFILNAEADIERKKEYLNSFGKFAEEKDSLAFKEMVCRPDNMELLGDRNLYWKILNKLWETNKGHKISFYKQWHKRWDKELDYETA